MRRRREHGSDPCRKHIPRGVVAVGWIRGPLPREPECFLSVTDAAPLPCDAHATPRRAMTRAFTSDTQGVPRIYPDSCNAPRRPPSERTSHVFAAVLQYGLRRVLAGFSRAVEVRDQHRAHDPRGQRRRRAHRRHPDHLLAQELAPRDHRDPGHLLHHRRARLRRPRHLLEGDLGRREGVGHHPRRACS